MCDMAASLVLSACFLTSETCTESTELVLAVETSAGDPLCLRSTTRWQCACPEFCADDKMLDVFVADAALRDDATAMAWTALDLAGR